MLLHRYSPPHKRAPGTAQIKFSKKISEWIGQFRRGGVKGKVVKIRYKDEEHVTTPWKELLRYGKVEMLPVKEGDSMTPVWADKPRQADACTTPSSSPPPPRQNLTSVVFNSYSNHSERDFVVGRNVNITSTCTGRGESRGGGLSGRLSMGQYEFVAQAPVAAAAPAGNTSDRDQHPKKSKSSASKSTAMPPASTAESQKCTKNKGGNNNLSAAELKEMRRLKNDLLPKGGVVYIPHSAFPDYPQPANGYWVGSIESNMCPGRPTQVKIKVPGEQAFYEEVDKVTNWRCEPEVSASRHGPGDEHARKPEGGAAATKRKEKAAAARVPARKRVRRRKDSSDEEEDSVVDEEDLCDDEEESSSSEHQELDSSDVSEKVNGRLSSPSVYIP